MRWHNLTGASYNEAMNTPLSVILRYTEFADIEISMKEKNKPDGKSK